MLKLVTLHDLLTAAEGFAFHEMQSTGQCPPCLFFTDDDGQAGSLRLAPDEADEPPPDRLVELARITCLAYDASACVFVSEIWATLGAIRPGETNAAAARRLNAENGPPAEDFARREMVMFLGETRERRLAKVVSIVRSDNGKFWNFGDPDVPTLNTRNGDDLEDRFAPLLTRHPVTASLRALARMVLQFQNLTPVPLISRRMNRGYERKHRPG